MISRSFIKKSNSVRHNGRSEPLDELIPGDARRWSRVEFVAQPGPNGVRDPIATAMPTRINGRATLTAERSVAPIQ
jgi:hypothetical protein